MFVDLYFAHGALDLLLGQTLQWDLFGHEEAEVFVVVD